jgi:hypoxanthine phosphoribosyltransferase
MKNNLKKYIDHLEIKAKIQSLANILNQTYQGKQVVIIGVLKGSICFLSDLIRELDFTFTVEFINAYSYGMKGKNPNITKIGEIAFCVKDKEVILLDDIFDRGETLHKIYKELLLKKPKSITNIVLLKKRKKRLVDFQPEYFLFEIEDDFVVGYGLDYKEMYRGLKDICIMN